MAKRIKSEQLAKLIKNMINDIEYHCFLSNSYGFFNLYPSPVCFVHAPLIGFVAALSYYQIKDYRLGKL